MFFGGADPNFTNGGFTTEDEFNLFDLDEEGGAVLLGSCSPSLNKKENKTLVVNPSSPVKNKNAEVVKNTTTTASSSAAEGENKTGEEAKGSKPKDSKSPGPDPMLLQMENLLADPAMSNPAMSKMREEL